MTVFARGIRVAALASVAVLGVACSSGGSAKKSDTTTAKKDQATASTVSSGLRCLGKPADGLSFKFQENFDPTKVSVCLKAGATDMGCFVKGQA